MLAMVTADNLDLDGEGVAVTFHELPRGEEFTGDWGSPCVGGKGRGKGTSGVIEGKGVLGVIRGKGTSGVIGWTC